MWNATVCQTSNHIYTVVMKQTVDDESSQSQSASQWTHRTHINYLIKCPAHYSLICTIYVALLSSQSHFDDIVMFKWYIRSFLHVLFKTTGNINGKLTLKRFSSTSPPYRFYSFISLTSCRGKARTQPPTTTNYAVESPTCGDFVGFQPNRSAMVGPRPKWTTFMIVVSLLPGKYALTASKTT